MKITKTMHYYNTGTDFNYKPDEILKEEKIEETEVKGFTECEIQLLKKWHELWTIAFEEDSDDWDEVLKKEFAGDDYTFIKKIDWLNNLYELEPDDLEILEDNNIKIIRRTLKYLTVEFFPGERYNSLITEYVVKREEFDCSPYTTKEQINKILKA